MFDIDYGQSLVFLVSSSSRGKDIANAGFAPRFPRAGIGGVFSAAQRTQEGK